MNDIKERLKLLEEYYNLSGRALERHLGLSRGIISGKGKAIGSDKLAKIYVSRPEINLIWLITGEGEMLNQNTDNLTVVVDPKNPYAVYLTEKIEKSAIEIGRLRKENETLKQEVNELRGQKKYIVSDEKRIAAEP